MVGLQLPVQSVPITTDVVSSYPVHCKVYSIQHYVIKFVSDLRQISGFFPGPPVSTTNKTDLHNIAEILLKVVLNTTKQANNFEWKQTIMWYCDLPLCPSPKQHIKKLSPLNGPFLKMSLSHENTRNIWRMQIYRIQSFIFLLFNKFILQYLFLDIM